VYFDDLTVRQGKINVVQAVDYYPFGMEAVSYTRTAADPTEYLYNGGVEKNDLTGYYETFYRSYDPSIGRIHQIDPKAVEFPEINQYNYAFNDPILYSDPKGDCPTCWWEFGEDGASQPMTTAEQWQYMGDAHMTRRNGIPRDPDYLSPQEIYNQSKTMIYNASLGEWVPAREILRHDPTNQNPEYRQEAFDAVKEDPWYDKAQPYVDAWTKGLGLAVGITETDWLFTEQLVKQGRIPSSKAPQISKLVRGAGAIGVVISASGAVYNAVTGNVQASDILDVVVAGGAYLATLAAITNPVALTAIAAGGVAYGVVMMAGGEEALNNSKVGKWVKSNLQFDW